MRAIARFGGAVLLGFALASCAGLRNAGNDPDRAAVVAALDSYRAAVLSNEPEHALRSFAGTAELSHGSQPALVGRAAIGKLLASFSSYQVVSYELQASSTEATANGYVQRGIYRQSVITPQGQRIQVSGSFEATWARDTGGSWLITKMHTTAGGAGGG